MNHRFADIARRNTDLATLVDIGNGTFIDQVGNSLTNLIAIAPQKTLAVDSTFVFGIQATINNVTHIATFPIRPLRRPEIKNRHWFYTKLLGFSDPQIP